MTMRLLPEEMVVGAVSCPPNCESTILIATRLGKFAKLLVSSIRVCQRGDLGEIGLTIKDSNRDQDRVVDICNGNRLVGNK